MSPPSSPGSESRLALAAGIGCYLIWGFVPLAFQAMGRFGASSWEIMAHRIAWGAPTALVLALVARQGPQIVRVLRNPRVLAWLCLSSGLIATNWAVYIWSVNSGRVLEGSFGYYITPLINMASGAVIFRERIDRIGAVAIGFAAVGVLFQGLALGHLPIISLVLAFSFGGYGVVRKQVQADAQTGLFIECLLLILPAVGFLLWLGQHGQGHFGSSTNATAWLVLAGPITAVPLALFAWCARRLPLSTIAFMQFIGPTIGFAIGVAQHEPFGPLNATAFAFIWTGAAVFLFGAWRRSRQVRMTIAQVAPVE
jgi:chloramphenicol-sensitive protein RarD